MYRTVLLILIIVALASCRDKRQFTVSKIQDAAKLATTETIIDKIVLGNEEKKAMFFITLGKARVVCFTQAIVKTGIDLKKITRDDVKINGNQIELFLPAVEVVSFSYPFEKFRIDSAMLDNGLFARISVEDLENFYAKAETDIRNQLPYMGLAEATENKTRVLLQGLLRAIGYQEIYISFRKGPLSPETVKKI